MSEKMETKTVKELETICKEMGITYYVKKRHLTKSEMIEKINNNGNVKNEVAETETEKLVENVEKPVETKETTNVEKKNIVIVRNDNIIGTDEFKLPDPQSFLDNENREMYIEKAEVGTLVAFLDEKGKPRTAKIVNRSSKRRLLKVVTEFDWEFIVSYDKVLWVKNGTRWPKGIYLLLKGYSKYGKRADK